MKFPSNKKLQQLQRDLKIVLPPEIFKYAISVELEHGSRFGKLTNVTGDDLYTTGRIVLAHLQEFPDYYQRLRKMEAQAEKWWKKKCKKDKLFNAICKTLSQ